MPGRRTRGDAGRALARRGVIDALNAANALRPFDRRHPPSLVSFALGWPTSELALQRLALQAVLTARHVRRGALRTPAGRAGLLAQAASAAQLVAVARIAAGAEPVLRCALTEALGEGYAVRHPWDGPARPPGLVRTALSRRTYARVATQRYGPYGGANTLDIWRHPDLGADARAPVVVQVPGGAWVTGDRTKQAYPLMGHLARLGWVCVPISYRLAPRNRWPAQIEDVKRAIAWVKDHIAEFGGDPDFVCITGGSAGGHLSSLAALTAGDPAFQAGFEAADTSVRAAVPFYGAYDLVDDDRIGHSGLVPFVEERVVGLPRAGNEQLYAAASPMCRVHEGAPPTFAIHGVNDSLIPVEQGDAFVRRLRAVSTQPVAYARLPGAQHAFDIFGSGRSHATARAVGDFLGHVYAGYVQAGR
jgi:acetyl esterase/lipase